MGEPAVIRCAHCGLPVNKAIGAVNRALRIGAPLFCNRICSGLRRRIYKPVPQKKEEKRLYDIEYRAKNLALIKERKRAYFQETYDPIKAAQLRKINMSRHVEYCRRPEYRAYKKQYDEQYQARKFGAFSESFLLLKQLDKEIESRISKYEVYLQNETINKCQNRRREYERIIGN